MINISLSRRDFFKRTGQTALTLVAGGTFDTILQGCASLTFEEQAPVIYPSLKGHKIQPPINGCYIGFYNHSRSLLEGYYGDTKLVGKAPKIFMMSFPRGRKDRRFPEWWAKKVSSEYKAIPYIHYTMYHSHYYGDFGNLLSNKDFSEDIEQYAKDIVAFGKPIFFCTMREMNDTRSPLRYSRWRPWKGRSAKPKYCIEVWQYMWQIFEDNGANEYATWVWSTIPTESTGGKLPHSEEYYPGDKFVDWIGLSAYCETKYSEKDKPFSSLAGLTYRSMRINHPDKPIMMCELGRTSDSFQYRWYQDTYKTIKSWPGLKAVINTHDPTWVWPINEESFNELKRIFRDSYFIGVT